MPEAFAATPIGAHDGIVVNIVLYGGNDGLNTVVPYTNRSYYDVRGPSNGNLAIPAGSGPAARRHVRAAPEPRLHQATVGCRSGGDRPRRRLPQPRPVALHVDGDLDERPSSAAVRRAPAGSGVGSTANRRRPPTSWPRPSARRCRCTCSARSAAPSPSRRTARHVRQRHRCRRTCGCTTGCAPCRRVRAGRGPWHDMYSQRR